MTTKVLHIELSSSLGGIESFLLNLYRAINREEFHFDFITSVDNPACAKELKGLGATVHHVSPHRQVLTYGKDIERVLRDGQYDIVHMHKNSAINIVPFRAAARYGSAKVIAHSHNTAPSQQSAFAFMHSRNMKYLYEHSDAHLACSEVAGQWLYGEKPFKVVENGIDSRRYKYDCCVADSCRAELGIRPDALVVGHVGRFTPQKNHRQLLQIFERIHILNPNSKLVLVGDGPLRDDVVAEADMLGIKDAVVFCGVRNDVNRVLMAMDCMVYPSLYEGLPIACVEGQASGLPMFLASSISEQTYITKNVEAFNLEDAPTDIASRVVSRLHIRPSEKERWLDNCVVCQSKFDVSALAATITGVYRTVLAAK